MRWQEKKYHLIVIRNSIWDIQYAWVRIMVIVLASKGFYVIPMLLNWWDALARSNIGRRCSAGRLSRNTISGCVHTIYHLCYTNVYTVYYKGILDISDTWTYICWFIQKYVAFRLFVQVKIGVARIGLLGRKCTLFGVDASNTEYVGCNDPNIPHW